MVFSFNKSLSISCLSLAATCLSTGIANAASFQTFDGNYNVYSQRYANDGSTFVGLSESANGLEAFISDATHGMQGLGDLAGGSFFSDAFGISGDGSTVVGYSASENGYEAFIWDATNSMVGLGDLAGGSFFSNAYGVSGDGSTVVGISASDNGAEAFIWDATNDMQGLGDLAGGGFYSEAHNASDDGSTVVGLSESANGYEAFIWDATNGMVGLGDLAGGGFYSYAQDISGDGSTVIGVSESANGYETFIWDTTNGMRSLKNALQNDYGFDLAGWYLSDYAYISDDGLTIAGYGSNSNSGYNGAWIAQLGNSNPTSTPESGTVLGLLAVGFLGFKSVKRK